jgi:hypothetical protein
MGALRERARGAYSSIPAAGSITKWKALRAMYQSTSCLSIENMGYDTVRYSRSVVRNGSPGCQYWPDATGRAWPANAQKFVPATWLCCGDGMQPIVAIRVSAAICIAAALGISAWLARRSSTRPPAPPVAAVIVPPPAATPAPAPAPPQVPIRLEPPRCCSCAMEENRKSARKHHRVITTRYLGVSQAGVAPASVANTTLCPASVSSFQAPRPP